MFHCTLKKRAVSENSQVVYNYNYKYSGTFTIVDPVRPNLEENLYTANEDTDKLKERLNALNTEPYLNIKIESSVEGWDGMEYFLSREEGKEVFLYPKGYDFGYYENSSDENVIYRFKV